MQSKAPTSDPTNFFGPILYHGIFPLMLITLCPITVVSIVHANKELDGSITALFDLYFQKGFTAAFGEIWKTPDFETWKILSIFVAFEAFLLLMVPGKIHRGPLTQTAHTPVYTANGFQCFSITMVVFLAMQYYGLYDFAIIYDKFPQIIAACCVFSLIFCAFLVFKGVYFPSSTDNLVSGNPIMDYFWGIEVYPRFGNLDLKTLVNCRVGMMGWALLLLCYLFKQSQLQHGEVSNSMYISVGVQLIYIAKFFWWETGYFDSIDIMHDRFGFYICWGCLTWLPSLYTNCTFYLVNHPVNLPTPLADLVFLAGVAAVAINYAIDEERQRFRKTGGNTIIWGKKPEYVVAKYMTEDGKEKKSLLLVSGWWGISRHFNYVAELAAALLWTPPVQFNHFLPYFYFFYLVILLVHRSFRDESRCTKKYGKAYDEYKKRVPYKMIPGLL